MPLTEFNPRGTTAPCLAAVSPPPSATSPESSSLIKALKAIVNSRFGLTFSAPKPPYDQAWAEACKNLPVPEQNVCQFVARIRRQLRQPEAREAIVHNAEPRSCHSLYPWLPGIPRPLLRNEQLQQLAAIALGQSPAGPEMTDLEQRCPALWQLLMAEIYRTVTESETGLAEKCLPQLMRMPVVSNALTQLNPLLPTVVWVAQLLWQMRQKGVVDTLDHELKLHINHWLSALEGTVAVPGRPYIALADKNLWHSLDRWVQNRLSLLTGSDGAQPLVEPAFSSTGRVVTDAPECTPDPLLTLPAMPAHGWQVNSVLNRASEKQTALLVQVQTCYELLQLHKQPLNLAVGCALPAVNDTTPQADNDATTLSHSLVIDEAGAVYNRIQIESGDQPFILQGVNIPPHSRPVPVTQFAGPGDQLTVFRPQEAEIRTAEQTTNSKEKRPASYATAKTTEIKRDTGQPHSVNISPSQPPYSLNPFRPGEMELSMPLRPGFFNGLVHEKVQKKRWQQPTTVFGSAWPLSGAVAARPDSYFKTLQKIKIRENIVDSFYESLQIKYPGEIENHELVTLTTTENDDTREEIVPLPEALARFVNVEDEIQQKHISLACNLHWSTPLCSDVVTFITSKYFGDIDNTIAMDWQSAANQQASWWYAVGAARKSLDKMAEILHKIQSPIWNVNLWITNKANEIISEENIDLLKFNSTTQVGVGVIMPASYNRQHMPILDRSLEGSWQPIGNYTVTEILTREYLRNNNFRYESLHFRFPEGISQKLQEKILQLDLQSLYMAELTTTLSSDVVKDGMLSLFSAIVSKAIGELLVDNKSIFENNHIRLAVTEKRYYLMNWHGYAINNIIFIPIQEGKINEGIILSLRDGGSWDVKIDPSGSISFFDTKTDAVAVLNMINKNLPIKVQTESPLKEIKDNQIIIDSYGQYKVTFHGKTFAKKVWIAPTADKSLTLKKSAHLTEDLLGNFVRTLQSNMNYLVKSNAECQLDSAIEILYTISTMVYIYTIPTIGISLTRASVISPIWGGANTGLRGALMLAPALSIFPKLVKASTADRSKEAKKAFSDAVLGIALEVAGFVLHSYSPNLITGLFKQGSKIVKATFDQLPSCTVQSLVNDLKQVISAYQNEIYPDGGNNFLADGAKQYHLTLLPERKAPAPVDEVRKVLANFPDYFASHQQNIVLNTQSFNDQAKMQGILQQYLQSNFYQVDIGRISRWLNIIDQPQIDYLLRVKSPSSDPDSPFTHSDDVVIWFDTAKFISGNPEDILLYGAEEWLLSQPKNSAISIDWFATPEYSSSDINLLPLDKTPFSEAVLTYPDWYKKCIKNLSLNNIEVAQENTREQLSKQEAILFEQAVISDNSTLSLILGQHFTQHKLQPADELGQKIALLSRYPISQQPTPLPEGDYILVGTDLRGIDADNDGNITLTDFGSSAPLLRQNRLQGYAPTEIIPAGMAAEISSLYAPGIDEFLINQPGEFNNTLSQLRLQRLEQNTRWLERPGNNFHVPLIVAVDRHQARVNLRNQLEATFPVDAILFVLTAKDFRFQVRNILLSLRTTPIPVSSLLTETPIALSKTVALANTFAMLPSLTNARRAVNNDKYQPWMPVINLQAGTQLINPTTAQQLREQTRADNYDYFLGDSPRRITSLQDISLAEPGARIAFLDREAGPGEPPMSHAMLMVGNGTAVGVNNQVIGSGEQWQKIYLAAGNWIQDEQHGFVLKTDDHKLSLHIQTSLLPPVPPSSISTPTEPNYDLKNTIKLAEFFTDYPSAQWAKDIGEGESWQAIIKLFAHGWVFDNKTADHLLTQTSAENYQQLVGESAQIIRSTDELMASEPGSFLVFVEKQQGKRIMVHAMIMANNGFLVGINNQIIGGQAGWQKIHITRLQYDANNLHGLVITACARKFNCIITSPMD